MAASLFRRVEFPTDVRPGRLAPLAEAAASRLQRSKQRVAVFEATTAGLIQAALQAVPGASAYTAGGAVTYHPRTANALLSGDFTAPKPPDGASYRQSKNDWTQHMARRMRRSLDTTWCLSESGACGPTFNYPDINTGFCSIFVSGPIERGIVVQSPHNNREENMWGFAKLALDLLAECVEEASTSEARRAGKEDEFETFEFKEDRYGGVELSVNAEVELVKRSPPGAFGNDLERAVAKWKADGKKGLWLKIPLECAHFVAPAIACGFEFHHAQSSYIQLTQWLPEGHSHLPRYGFTQIGVGGVVLNSKNEVLMVKERVSPLPIFQGQWKLPGGAADPGEDFAETAMREVLEETGIKSEPVGVVSLRHNHGYRFGQGDIYVLVRLRATFETIEVDPHELLDARWMSREAIEAALVPADYAGDLEDRVSANNWKLISNALDGTLIEGREMPNSRGGRPSILYTAPPPTRL